MRTIENALKELKLLDPQTDITDWFIRCLVRDNKIHYINSGKKIWLDLDNLIEYFNMKEEK